jgi:hypothetical protein
MDLVVPNCEFCAVRQVNFVQRGTMVFSGFRASLSFLQFEHEPRGASVRPPVEVSSPSLQLGQLSVLPWLTRQAVDPGL